jgi:hypothetical protein
MIPLSKGTRPPPRKRIPCTIMPHVCYIFNKSCPPPRGIMTAEFTPITAVPPLFISVFLALLFS